MRPWIFAAGLALVAAPAVAQQLVYSFEPVLSCLDAADSDDGKALCIGRAASACMTRTEGGESTVGMSNCLNAELEDWDGWLNEVYAGLRARYEDDDARAQDQGWNAPALAPALRDMQRAWIGFRDAACSFEAAQWGGGTGGGPAYVGCLMDETARQVLYLQGWVDMR